jgi:hypothetical protein
VHQFKKRRPFNAFTRPNVSAGAVGNGNVGGKISSTATSTEQKKNSIVWEPLHRIMSFAHDRTCDRSVYRTNGKPTANLPCDPYFGLHVYEHVSNVGVLIPCFHTSIMDTDPSEGKELPLNVFSPGIIIALKSAKFDLSVPRDNDWASVSPRMDLDLWNINNDIILRITILRGTNKVFFNDHANKSLLDGWGQEKSVELSQEDVDKWQRSGVTISVHDCSTPSKEQYQILFDLITICHFDKRFPGPPIKIEYSAQRSPDDTSDSGIPAHGILSDPLKVFTYNLDDLPLVEKQAVKSGG